MRIIHIVFFAIIFSITFFNYACKSHKVINIETHNYADSLLHKAFELRKSQPETAILCAEKVLNICAGNSPKKEALAYRRIGLASYYKEYYNEAIDAYNRSFLIEKRIGQKIGMVASLNLKAKVHNKRGEYDKAFDIYLQSSRIGENMTPSPVELGDAYNSIGTILSKTKQFGKTKQYFEKALKIRMEQNDSLRLASTYQDMGGMFYRTWELDDLVTRLDTAMDYYIKSELLYRELKHQKYLAKILNNKGCIYLLKGDIKNANKNFEESLQIKEVLLDSLGMAITTYNTCQLYFAQNYNEEAINYCYRAIAYTDTLRDYDVLASSYYQLYEIEKHLKNTSKALSHYEAYSTWNDKLNTNKKNIEIQRIINEYEIKKGKAETQQQQNMLTTGMFSSLIMALGLLFYSRSKKKLHQEEQKRRIQEEQLRKETEGRRIEEQKLYNQVIKTLEKDAEIQAVNAEIDAKLRERTKVASTLHDSVCSSLVSARMHMESVQNNIVPQDKAVFARGFGLLDEAYNICREISHDLSPPMLAKFGLAQAIEDLCERFSTPQICIQFSDTSFDERLYHQQELTLYQSIQELLQNILKHSAASEAHVQLTDYGDSLNILVEDDGKGFDTAEISDNSSGLQRIRTRIKHLGGNMDVDSSPGNGTTVIIDVPKTLSTHEIIS